MPSCTRVQGHIITIKSAKCHSRVRDPIHIDVPLYIYITLYHLVLNFLDTGTDFTTRGNRVLCKSWSNIGPFGS